MASGGNFFVREPVKRILETVAPGQCAFVATRHSKTGEVTDWILAIPNHQQVTAPPPTQRERCPDCDEPWCFHCYSESQPREDVSSPTSTRDVFKARQWSCHRVPFKGWGKPRPQLFPRQLYFSVRLEKLFKKLKLRGLSRSGACKAQPDAADAAWVEEQLRRIQSSQEPPSVATNDAKADMKWLENHVAKNARKGVVEFDFDALERRENCRLPASYREFAPRLGRKRYGNFQGEEGLTLTLLPPGDLDFTQFANSELSEGQLRRAVVFATLNNGDVLCFDLAQQDTDAPVYHYDHETDDFELFAPSFPVCIRRLVEG